MSEISLRGQAAIVTDAARGLGRSYAMELAGLGAAVVVNDVPDPEPAANVVEKIEAGGGQAIASLHSVATREGGRAVVADALERCGRVDVVVNNAGFLHPAFFEQLSLSRIGGWP